MVAVPHSRHFQERCSSRVGIDQEAFASSEQQAALQRLFFGSADRMDLKVRSLPSLRDLAVSAVRSYGTVPPEPEPSASWASGPLSLTGLGGIFPLAGIPTSPSDRGVWRLGTSILAQWALGTSAWPHPSARPVRSFCVNNRIGHI